jgi:predicted anti-sigma-YlaC factor YlaD
LINVLAYGVLLQGLPVLGGNTMSMTCKATIRLICEYLEGRLAPEVGSEVQRHLSYCRNCRTVFDAAALTLEVYFDREVEPVSADRSRVA